jgi:hypothetical protein
VRRILLFSAAVPTALVVVIGCGGASSGTGATNPSPQSASASTAPSADPAGQKFDAWLSAINRADRASLERLNSAFASMYMKMAEQGGGYDVDHFVEATRTERVALVRAKKSGEWSCLKFRVQADAPHSIQMVMLGRGEAPSNAKRADPLPPLDDKARRDVIEALVREIHDNYVFADKAAAIESDLRARQGRGAYTEEGRLALAEAVNQDIQGVSHDRHLRLQFLCAPSPDSPSADASAARPAGPASATPGGTAPRTGVIGSTKRFDGNVAYIEITAFGDHTEAVADEFQKALNTASDAAAVIFDLRQNGGGHEENVRFVASYLFGNDAVQLSTTYRRSTNRTEPVFTDPRVPGAKIGPDKPVFILTSKGTFSAPESFAYDLQALKRAVIVGEVTGGGAHPGNVISLPQGMSAFIPNGRPINPITKTDWEGVGVKPDVAVPADKALETAHELVRARLATGAGARGKHDRPAP